MTKKRESNSKNLAERMGLANKMKMAMLGKGERDRHIVGQLGGSGKNTTQGGGRGTNTSRGIGGRGVAPERAPMGRGGFQPTAIGKHPPKKPIKVKKNQASDASIR